MLFFVGVCVWKKVVAACDFVPGWQRDEREIGEPEGTANCAETEGTLDDSSETNTKIMYLNGVRSKAVQWAARCEY